MRKSQRKGHRARRWELLAATGAGTGAAAAVIVALAVALPPTLVNLSTEVSDGETPFPISSQSSSPDPSASIVVPEGWAVRRTDDALLITTPDALMSVTVHVVPAAAGGTLIAKSTPVGPIEKEVLVSGLTVVHADLPRGAGVVAAVSIDAPLPSTVLVTSSIRGGADAETYRPALAALLEGIS